MQTPGIICKDCGKPALRTAPFQKYCRPCSDARDAERKRRWARNNPQPAECKKGLRRNKRTAVIDLGKAISAESASGMADAVRDVNLEWLVRISMPFAYAASKNHIYSLAGRGHVYLREESKAYRDAIILAVREALAERKVVTNKLWLDIFVQKTNHKGDAINFVDLVCDAVKIGAGVDDRWFSLRRVDWEIVKSDPRVFIGIGQEAVANAQACSSCGRLLPYESFNKNRHAKNGITRNCRDCRRAEPRRRGVVGVAA